MAKRKQVYRGVNIKSPQQITKMQQACQLASTILQEVAAFCQPGINTKEVDTFAAERIKHHQCTSAFLGYRNFPGNICISKNEVIVHGIGSDDNILIDGDIVSIDVGVIKDGWIGDNALTIPIGNIDDTTKHLLQVTEQSLYEAIALAKEGELLADLCGAVDAYVSRHNLVVVHGFVGHGVGKKLHEAPEIPNYRSPHIPTLRLKEGMVFAIEPMVNQTKPGYQILADNWTAISEDNLFSAHFEHTVLVGKDAPVILTDRPRLFDKEILAK